MISSLRFSKSTLLFTMLVVMVVAGSVVVRANVARKHSFPEGDEGPWLRMAARVFTGDFLTSTVVEHDLYATRELPHPEDNRSPLFPILLRAGTVFSPNIFSAAQIVNIGLFVAGIALCCVILYRRFGKPATVLFILFTGVSPIFIINTAHIYNDVTIATGFFAVLLCAGKVTASRWSAVGFGIGIGLLFLMKISSIFLLVPVGIYFVLQGFTRENGVRAALFFFSFLILAAPWMIRNISHFGAPLYQFTGYTMWIDSMKEIFSVNIPHPGMGAYVDAHGVFFTFVIRPLVGCKNVVLQILTHDHNLTLALLPFVLFGAWRLRKAKRFWLPIFVFSVPYIGLMAHVAFGFWVDRYLLVYYLLIYLLAGIGMVAVTELVKNIRLRYGILLLTATLPLATVAYPLEYYLSARGNEKTIDAAARSIIRDIQPLVPDSTAVLSSFLGGYAFLHNMHVVNTIEFNAPANLGVLVDAYSIRYALLSAQDTTIFNMIIALVGSEGVRCLRRNESYSFYSINNEKLP